MKYQVIVADPAWQFDDKLTMSDVKRGAAANYNTLSLQELAELPVDEVALEDSLLALWVPASLLNDGIFLMQAWGFNQKQIYTWVKTSKTGLAFGLGRYFRGCSEFCLIGTKGKVSKLIQSKSERNVELSPALPHSQKPEGLQNSLERMLPEGPYLELFGRRSRPNWLVVGNQSPDTPDVDIRDWFENIKKIT